MLYITRIAAIAALVAVAGTAAVAQVQKSSPTVTGAQALTEQERLNGPEDPANMRPSASSNQSPTVTGAQAYTEKDRLDGPEPPANMLPNTFGERKNWSTEGSAPKK